jgi:hypothetical protein
MDMYFLFSSSFKEFGRGLSLPGLQNKLFRVAIQVILLGKITCFAWEIKLFSQAKQLVLKTIPESLCREG